MLFLFMIVENVFNDYLNLGEWLMMEKDNG